MIGPSFWYFASHLPRLDLHPDLSEGGEVVELGATSDFEQGVEAGDGSGLDGLQSSAAGGGVLLEQLGHGAVWGRDGVTSGKLLNLGGGSRSSGGVATAHEAGNDGSTLLFKRLVKAPLESYCYHVMSRTCGGEIFFDEVEKEALRRVIWRMAEFCGVKVVTYCLMGNHFHLLAELPHRETWLQRFDGPQGEAKLLEHLRILYCRTYVGLLRDELADLRQRGLEVLVQQKLEAIKRRFCDLSLFVKEIKERFSRWFNKRRGRRGTLWMDRFKSVLVEGKGEALRKMAAYIDLNPVRAGLVKDPKDYRWCGYAEALGGSRRAQRGLCKAIGKPVDGWQSAGAAEAYRCLLFDEGREVKDAQNEKVVERGVSVEEAREVLADHGIGGAVLHAATAEGQTSGVNASGILNAHERVRGDGAEVKVCLGRKTAANLRPNGP